MIDDKPRTVPCAHCQGTGTITLPPEIETIEAYYFGCWDQSGHFWRTPKPPWRNERDIEERLPIPLRKGKIDTGFCPGVDFNNTQKRRSRPEVEGEAHLHHVDGWTILSWWDNSVDRRPGSNSSLVVLGTHDFTTVLAVADAQIPHVMKRQRRQLVLIAPPCEERKA